MIRSPSGSRIRPTPGRVKEALFSILGDTIVCARVLDLFAGTGAIGFEARVYDPAFPTLDAYGNIKVAHGVQLFGGERDITHSGRRTVFGLQLQF